MPRPVIKFKYLNHSGKIAERTVTVDSIEFIQNTCFGYQPGWFVSGHCHDKNARRSFALSRILFEDEAGQSKSEPRMILMRLEK